MLIICRIALVKYFAYCRSNICQKKNSSLRAEFVKLGSLCKLVSPAMLHYPKKSQQLPDDGYQNPSSHKRGEQIQLICRADTTYFIEGPALSRAQGLHPYLIEGPALSRA